MAYTASITNCTFPSCSYLESIPMRSWPAERKGQLTAKCTESLSRPYHLQFLFYSSVHHLLAVSFILILKELHLKEQCGKGNKKTFWSRVGNIQLRCVTVFAANTLNYCRVLLCHLFSVQSDEHNHTYSFTAAPCLFIFPASTLHWHFTIGCCKGFPSC